MAGSEGEEIVFSGNPSQTGDEAGEEEAETAGDEVGDAIEAVETREAATVSRI